MCDERCWDSPKVAQQHALQAANFSMLSQSDDSNPQSTSSCTHDGEGGIVIADRVSSAFRPMALPVLHVPASHGTFSRIMPTVINAALFYHQLVKNTDEDMMFDNEVIHDIVVRAWKLTTITTTTIITSTATLQQWYGECLVFSWVLCRVMISGLVVRHTNTRRSQ